MEPGKIQPPRPDKRPPLITFDPQPQLLGSVPDMFNFRSFALPRRVFGDDWRCSERGGTSCHLRILRAVQNFMGILPQQLGVRCSDLFERVAWEELRKTRFSLWSWPESL